MLAHIVPFICFWAFLVTCTSQLAAQDSAQKRLFREWDRNRDGVLTKQEVPAGPRSNFEKVDKNGDGKVTLKEHLAATSNAGNAAKNSRNARIKRHLIPQKWTQEPKGFEREYFVSLPSQPQESWPLTFVFHGNGGQAESTLRNWPKRLPGHLVVAPQGYEKSWNISDERSRAPDVDFFREMVFDLKEKYPKADISQISILGFSNGAGMVFRLLIEADDSTPIQNAVPMVSSMVTEQYHDGRFWKRANDGKNQYDVKTDPLGKSKILTIHGTNDKIVPYNGGKRGRNAIHLSAQDTAFAWARHQGYEGRQLKDDQGKRWKRDIIEYDYPQANVTHLKVVGAGHGFGRHSKNINDRVVAFIQSKPE